MDKLNNAERRGTCFFCTSPFQLFSIISLAQLENDKTDLYIDPQFENALDYSLKIREEGIFENVYVINTNRIYDKYFTYRKGFINHLQIARSYIKVNEIVPMIIEENVVYDNIYVSSKAYIPRLVCLYYIKNKLNARVHYFDDGVGSYFADSVYTPKGLDTLLRRVLFGKEAVRLDYERCLLFPEFFKELNPDCRYEIREVPKRQLNSNEKDIFNSLFSVPSDIVVREHAILLDEPVEEILTEKGMDTIKEIYSIIPEAFGKDNVIVKLHPRNFTNKNTELKCFEKSDIPFECICMNTDIGSKVLISLGSTAAATPKLLLGKEPYVVMLYKMVESKKNLNEVLNSFFQALKRCYEDSNRVYIPESLPELEIALSAIRNELG